MRLRCAFLFLAGCGAGTSPTGGDADAGVDAGALPTVAEICAARDECVGAADPHAGPCADVLGVLEESSDPSCEPCRRCLASASCENWTESPNGPLGCEDSCRPCQIAGMGSDDGEFWDACNEDADCAYAHFCLETIGRCQRVCDEGAQCNLTFCGEDRRCWLACGDARCPDPEAACTDEVRDSHGNVFSVCAGGE